MVFAAPAQLDRGATKAGVKIEKAGPSHKPSLFFTALAAVLFGRRHSASLLVSSLHKRRPCCEYSIQN
jgi:hypothetical protein